MIKHTPAPWSVDAMGNIWATDNKVAEMSTQPPQSDQYRRKSTKEHEANAEHIVKCVNYHDRLVEALDNSMNTVEAMLTGFRSVNAENCIRESAALLAELSAHNGGEG